MGRRARSTNRENKFGHSPLSLSSNSFLISPSLFLSPPLSLWKRNETKTRETHRAISSLELFLGKEQSREEDRSSGKLWNRRLSWVTLSRHVTVSESLPLRPRRTIGRRGLTRGPCTRPRFFPLERLSDLSPISKIRWSRNSCPFAQQRLTKIDISPPSKYLLRIVKRKIIRWINSKFNSFNWIFEIQRDPSIVERKRFKYEGKICGHGAHAQREGKKGKRLGGESMAATKYA